MKRLLRLFLAALALSAAACVRTTPEVIVITATFAPSDPAIVNAPPGATAIPATFAAPAGTPIVPTADAARPAEIISASEYTVQPGDTLIGISTRLGIPLETLQTLNNLADADQIAVGQILQLPDAPTIAGSDFKILPDSRLVRAPGSGALDINGFIAAQPGYVRTVTDEVDGVILNAAQILNRVSLEFSIDARLLIALLEYNSGWLSNPSPAEPLRTYPLGAPASLFGFDRDGLYLQLAWTADKLNLGYYAWRQASLNIMTLTDGTRVQPASGLNAGTAAVQSMYALRDGAATWPRHVSTEGLYATYLRLFGDPFAGAIEPLVPLGLAQPPMALPFPAGETWYYTGGPHGGWGAGSAWAAVDFAPPDDPEAQTSGCYVSSFFASAIAPGVIARSGEGSVVLDLDGDGDESTGWTVLYLHIATRDRIAAGTRVNTGDRIGRPSCEGGVSNGTHVHLARRFNGEWIPASCAACPTEALRPAFDLGGWSVVGLINQEYQGYLVRGSERKVAEAMRNVADNQISG